jgi:prevent-host-death family protein
MTIMKEMAAGQFKAKCLAVMDEVKQTGESVLITKHGKAVAQLVPAPSPPDDIFDYMKGRAEIVGDIVGPITPEEDWELK